MAEKKTTEPRENEGQVPRIETIEGVGVEYLKWTKDTILTLLDRVDRLERLLND